MTELATTGDFALDPGRSSRPAAPDAATDWQMAVAQPSFEALLTARKAVVGPLLLVSLGYFFAFTLLAGFARPLMSVKVLGPLNVGYVLVLGTYLVCWLVAIAYYVAATRRFDPLAEAILDARGAARP